MAASFYFHKSIHYIIHLISDNTHRVTYSVIAKNDSKDKQEYSNCS